MLPPPLPVGGIVAEFRGRCFHSVIIMAADMLGIVDF